MANNEEQNAIEQVKETKKMAEESAKLAANASSGNLVGAAKNAVNLLKNKQFKKKLKRKLIKILILSMIPILIAICFFSLLNSLKDKVITFLSDTTNSIATFLSKTWQWLTDDYWIDLGKEMDYTTKDGETIKATIVDQYIYELDELGISLKDLRLLGDADYSNKEEILKNKDNKALVEKYIAEFIRADIITQQPHRRSGVELVDSNNQDKVDGGVYFYRTKKEASITDSEITNESNDGPIELDVTDKDYKQMEYISKEEFKELLDTNNANIRYKFSIDNDTGELLLAEIKTTTIVEDGSLKQSTYEVKEIKLPYREYISKYTMPYEFLINLCTITQNPEFVYHVALLARNTKIVLGVQDNTTIRRETRDIEEDYQYFKNGTSSTDGADAGEITTKKRKIVTTTTVQTPTLRVEYANTWSFYDEFEYTKNVDVDKDEPPVVPEIIPLPPELRNHHEAIPPETDPVTNEEIPNTGRAEYWDDTLHVQTRTKIQNITKTTIYNEAIIKQSVEKSKQFLGLLRNSTGKCEIDCYKEDAWRMQTPKAYECAKKAEFDIDGINVQYRIPNMTRTESPLNKLLSGLEMLYAVLQSNSSGYKEEDRLITNEQINQSYEIQDQYIANEDYESAYVVKMSGLVDHLRYLMTFPVEEESYTIKDLILDTIFGNEEDNNFNDIIIPPGVTANAAQIYDFLIGKGFTPESACAILGNMQQESSFNTAATNGSHFGLCQWGDGRFERLKNFAQNRGTEWTDLETQLEYLWKELCENYISVKNEIINSTDMEHATDIFCRRFEVCGNYGIEVPKRYRYAQYWYNIFVQGNNNENITPTQNNLLEVINNLSAYSGIQNDGGYCQRFVRTVFEQIGIFGSASSASNAEQKWKVSSDINNIPIGATVYGRGSSSDGHVGIYIGNGMVVHNTGNPNCSYSGMLGIKCEDINSWNRKYKFTSWGWQGGVDLSV